MSIIILIVFVIAHKPCVISFSSLVCYADVEKFIAVALKAVQLSGDAKTQRASLLKSLDTIKKKYPSLQQNAAPQKGKDESDREFKKDYNCAQLK